MKRALVSVSDKTGLIDFLKPLVENGLEIISTGGTLKFLESHQISVTDISAVTGFPEVLDGRVKTLHPFVHMGLLADKSNAKHMEQLAKHQVAAFDMVVGNLYPFEKAATNPNSTPEELIENIDIGGPSFLRSSAKNYQSVIVVSDPDDYGWVQEKILNATLTVNDRRELAIKVFSLTSYYDAMIVNKLASEVTSLKYLNLPLKKKSTLRYGENSQQQAAWYANPLSEVSLASTQFHQGKELSYNNILDLDASVGLVRHFETPTCVAVKHNNPCAVAQGINLAEALRKTIASDSKSIFGGILAFNKTVDLECCQLIKELFLECLIAPDFTHEALEFLKSKKNLRVLSWPDFHKFEKTPFLIKSVFGGVLQQSSDYFESTAWEIHGQAPLEQIKADMIFGEKGCAYLKSNAIAIVYKGQTVGLGMGQVNRVDAVQQAFNRYLEFSKSAQIDINQVVLVSDAFFPFADSIDIIARENIKWILQPGGSTRDAEVIQAATQNKINMVFSRQRHFRH